MSEFKPGQTVWHTASHKPSTVIAQRGQFVWLEDSGGLLEASRFTATDPNAKPLPQTTKEKIIEAFRQLGLVSAGRIGDYGRWSATDLATDLAPILDEMPAMDTPTPQNLILVDADKFEHLLNCMAQLDFLPTIGMHADEPIIRKAYQEAREMLHNPPPYGVPVQPVECTGDSMPLTEEWLRTVGLWDGLEVKLSVSKISVRMDERLAHRNDGLPVRFGLGREWTWKNNIRTIGDARALCRLLSVTLKESTNDPPKTPEKAYQHIVDDYARKEPYRG